MTRASSSRASISRAVTFLVPGSNCSTFSACSMSGSVSQQPGRAHVPQGRGSGGCWHPRGARPGPPRPTSATCHLPPGCSAGLALLLSWLWPAGPPGLSSELSLSLALSRSLAHWLTLWSSLLHLSRPPVLHWACKLRWTGTQEEACSGQEVEERVTESQVVLRCSAGRVPARVREEALGSRRLACTSSSSRALAAQAGVPARLPCAAYGLPASPPALLVPGPAARWPQGPGAGWRARPCIYTLGPRLWS